MRLLSNLINELEFTLQANQGQYPDRPIIEWSDDNKHIDMKSDCWTMSLWKESDVNFRPRHIIDDLEKIESELYYDLINDKNTTPRPKQYLNNYNIITNIGLTESAKRDTGEVSTTLDWNSIGTNATTPIITNTDLITEDSGGSYARKQYSVDGQRKVVNQTGKYGMLWTDADVSGVPLSIKESGIHWHLSDASKCHARVTFTTFSMSSGDLFATQLNELHENGA